MTLISPESSRVTRLGMTPASTTHLTKKKVEIQFSVHLRTGFSRWDRQSGRREPSRRQQEPRKVAIKRGFQTSFLVRDLSPVTSPLCLDAVSAGQGREGTA